LIEAILDKVIAYPITKLIKKIRHKAQNRRKIGKWSPQTPFSLYLLLATPTIMLNYKGASDVLSFTI